MFFSRLKNLSTLSLVGNRFSGPIPREIGDIATLEELVLDDNQLEGPLHENIGNLRNLRRLLLSANNFSGSIPESFGNLKNLTDFRIDGSNLTGKIPDFIGNWTKLTRLDLQGTSMEGPIPSSITLLTNLAALRITDLTGASSDFPNLQDMKSMRRLILRNCLITGTIPLYIGDLKSLKTFFLANNSLTGPVPDWILNSKKNLDLSYNNFSDSSPSIGCQQSDMYASFYRNLASSFSPLHGNSIAWCLMKDLPCPGKAKHHSLFINCGGVPITHEGNNYEADLSRKGPSNFASTDTRWAYSSTGVFMGNEDANYLATNQYGLNVTGAEYYKTARLSPQSLKYYGLCMRKGSYKVKLHFAEIMFTDNETYFSLGKRIFDVSIQGKLVLKDFNIAEEAGGIGREFTKEFEDVLVSGSTLEVHLYWAGKGTTAIPHRGVYGPLISAITVTPNFKVDTGGLSAGAIVGIVVCSCAAVILLLVVLWMKGCFGGKDLEDKELRALDLQTGYFTLRQIKAATNNFDPANKIGEGGFGPVYKVTMGTLSDGAVIAVKQLSSKSKQGNREFVNEIGMISALQHPNLVKLYGCCIEGNQLLLVYEYLENNSLARALFGKEEEKLNLDWKTRKKVCIEIARGLAYLHEESRLKIVHRDIKATNAYVLQEQGNLLELVDPSLGSKVSRDEALRMLNVALLCTNPSPTLRPAMSSVVSMLDGKVPVHAPIIKRNSDNQDARFKAFEIQSQDSQTCVTTFSEESQSQRSMSTDGPWRDSSASLQTADETREYSSSSTLLDENLRDINLQ
ncbi:hypothetical protein JRO89_XS15G0076700 [Xanthoceras sorbifolium]|uniref:non-specific serine/threonine protein kinase n=1 Tax=Xanthoceras sorbifolium TaxID=99658 RepID=A0ABQ8H1A0_9ROSI|nr:hypothetical protein JRO89_XS15G0076700 [Xanthoceras sorbifolium]